MLPIGVYLLVAVVIAGLAFAVAQLAPGWGMIVTLAASLGWTAYAANRAKALKN